jgi:peptide/nickel transport system permease protein
VTSLATALLRRPAGAFGAAIVGFLVLLCLFAPWVAPFDPADLTAGDRLQGPSLVNLFGTDQLGRDLLSRLIFGVRVELSVAVPAVAIGLALGLALGLPAGYLGGWVDGAAIILLDTMHALPAVIIGLFLLVLLGNSLANVMLVIALALAPGYARVARASVMALRKASFVEAERGLGAGRARIVLVHILPNILAPLLILMAMNIPTAITVETGLSFLGLGVQPPTPSWGVILADGFDRVRETPWAVIWTGLALSLTTLGFTFLGETLRDLLDPRLAGARR